MVKFFLKYSYNSCAPSLFILIGMIVVLVGILIIRLHPVLSLLIGALVVGLLTSPSLLQVYAEGKNLSPVQTAALLHQSPGERIAIGFGDTCAKTGLLMVLASIILTPLVFRFKNN